MKMKYISFLVIILIFSLNSYKSFGEDALTIKQELDRISEEIKDLNKAVFNKSFESDKVYSIDENKDIERFTSIDIRIYDLENDIKNLTLNIEEIIFKLEDLSKEMVSFENQLMLKLENIKIESQEFISDNDNLKNINDNEIIPENTLGKIVISGDGQTSINTNLSKSEIKTEEKIEQKLTNLTPEEQIQSGIDQLRKKNYSNSKEILANFIKNYPDNQLSGSAHYWLGKINLFEKNYREAALIFGDGIQKFPKSIKAAEMHYELIRSLKEMQKIPEACKILNLLEKNYKGSKFVKDPEKFRDKLDCKNNT